MISKCGTGGDGRGTWPVKRHSSSSGLRCTEAVCNVPSALRVDIQGTGAGGRATMCWKIACSIRRWLPSASRSPRLSSGSFIRS